MVGVSRPVKAEWLLIPAPVITATALSVVLAWSVIIIIGIVAAIRTTLRVSVIIPAIIKTLIASLLSLIGMIYVLLSVIVSIPGVPPILFMVRLTARIARGCLFVLG